MNVVMTYANCNQVQALGGSGVALTDVNSRRAF